MEATETAEELAKEAGIQIAVRKKVWLVRETRELARKFALSLKSREITADDAQALAGNELGNAAGAIFRYPEWEFTGKWVKSLRKGNHARMIRVWRLRE
jgi:hypothetical protein